MRTPRTAHATHIPALYVSSHACVCVFTRARCACIHIWMTCAAVWTNTIEPEEYVRFLRDLLHELKTRGRLGQKRPGGASPRHSSPSRSSRAESRAGEPHAESSDVSRSESPLGSFARRGLDHSASQPERRNSMADRRRTMSAEAMIVARPSTPPPLPPDPAPPAPAPAPAPAAPAPAPAPPPTPAPAPASRARSAGPLKLPSLDASEQRRRGASARPRTAAGGVNANLSGSSNASLGAADFGPVARNARATLDQIRLRRNGLLPSRSADFLMRGHQFPGGPRSPHPHYLRQRPAAFTGLPREPQTVSRGAARAPPYSRTSTNSNAEIFAIRDASKRHSYCGGMVEASAAAPASSSPAPSSRPSTAIAVRTLYHVWPGGTQPDWDRFASPYASTWGWGESQHENMR